MRENTRRVLLTLGLAIILILGVTLLALWALGPGLVPDPTPDKAYQGTLNANFATNAALKKTLEGAQTAQVPK